jgi:hypothetical protein
MHIEDLEAQVEQQPAPNDDLIDPPEPDESGRLPSLFHAMGFTDETRAERCRMMVLTMIIASHLRLSTLPRRQSVASLVQN